MKVADARIAISGKSGCGNTTVSRLVADGLGLRFINFTFRTLAEEHKITFNEVLLRAKHDDYWDRTVDERQVALARQDGGCVLGSRLAIWLLGEADLKVYLKAKSETRARRIQMREGGSLEAIAAFTQERDLQDHSRYRTLYDIDTDEYGFADLVVETDDKEPQEIASLVIAALEKKCEAL